MSDEHDWTRDEKGVSNNSARYLAAVNLVAGVISNTRLGDDPSGRARLIISQLAHAHGLSPVPRCKCPEIMAADHTRHFRGCPSREHYPETFGLSKGRWWLCSQCAKGACVLNLQSVAFPIRQVTERCEWCDCAPLPQIEFSGWSL